MCSGCFVLLKDLVSQLEVLMILVLRWSKGMTSDSYNILLSILLKLFLHPSLLTKGT